MSEHIKYFPRGLDGIPGSKIGSFFIRVEIGDNFRPHPESRSFKDLEDLNCVLIFFPLRFDEQKLRSLLKRFDLSLHKTIKTTANNFRKIFEVETFLVFKL